MARAPSGRHPESAGAAADRDLLVRSRPLSVRHTIDLALGPPLTSATAGPHYGRSGATRALSCSRRRRNGRSFRDVSIEG
jgi:hypothetical protein